MATVPAVLSAATLLAACRDAPVFLCVVLGLAAGFALAAVMPSQYGDSHGAGNAETPDFAGGAAPDRIALLDGVICEIRQPLSSIHGFAEFLASPAAADLKDSDLRAYRQLMVDTSRALFAFLAEARDYALFEKGELQLIETEVDAAELAEAAVKLCRKAVEDADVQLVADLQEEIDVTCDVSRFRQALVLLILDAVRGAPRGSTVHIALRVAPSGRLEFTLAASAPHLTAVEEMRAFEPDFARMGLAAFALPVARRLALLHSGEVTLSNLPHGGTLARLTLPASRLLRANAAKGSGAARAA